MTTPKLGFAAFLDLAAKFGCRLRWNRAGGAGWTA
jgi:hypothetical protein